MYISSVTVNNFRGLSNAKAKLHNGFNLIVGPNDSGKSTFIDAVRLALGTRTEDRLFIQDTDLQDGKPAPRVDITISFNDVATETILFAEYLTLVDGGGFRLDIYCEVRKNSSDYYYIRRTAGPSHENARELSATALDALRCTYLKPIRDASFDLGASQNSRLSKILKAHSVVEQNKDTIFNVYNEASKSINDLFANSSTDGEGPLYSSTTKIAQDYYNSFSENPSKRTANIGFKNPNGRSQKYLQSILQKLDIWTDENLPGLGTANALYMASELMLLDDIKRDHLKLALIEEIEAHIHPTRQLKIVRSLQEHCKKEMTQIIATTHSPNLASQAKIENLLLCHSGQLYSFDKTSTELDDNDCKYLERFLDVTRSNLFFSRGLIYVEGTTEQFLVPAFADLIDKNLVDHGISVINVNHLAFNRYVHPFIRKDDLVNPIPISIVTDADNKSSSDIVGIKAMNDNDKHSILWCYGLSYDKSPICQVGKNAKSSTFEKIILASGSDEALYKLYAKAYNSLTKNTLPNDYSVAYDAIKSIKAPLAQEVSIYINTIISDEWGNDLPSKADLAMSVKKLFPNIVEAIKHSLGTKR